MKTFWFDLFNLHQPRTRLPMGCNEADLLAFLNSIRVDGGPAKEFADYLDRDWRRFLYTWFLCRDLTGPCLEIGAAPYFTTALLTEFSSLDLVMSNYAPTDEKVGRHIVHWTFPRHSSEAAHAMAHDLFNVEDGKMPYPDEHFEAVLFCEVLEHLTNDPMAALIEIRRVLKPGGRLILTTPNAACLRNISRMLRGKSVADRYSGHGPYGRHNREYTPAEVTALLGEVGFVVQQTFTANVLFRRMRHLIANFLGELFFTVFAPKRARALGQYTFVSAIKQPKESIRRPDWLYRSRTDS